MAPIMLPDVGGPRGTNHVRTGRQSDWTFSAAWVRGEEHGTGTQIAAPDGRNRKSDLRLRRTGDRMAIYLSVNKAIRALWTPMKAPGSVRLQSLAWAALRWGSRRGREWGPAARAGCGRTRSLRGPASRGDGSERRESVGVRGAHLQRPARSSRGRAAVQCCPPVPREGTAARGPGFMEPAPPARPFPPSTGQLSASCKDTAQLNVQTPNRKRGGDPVVTPCAHEMPAVAEHRATRPGSYEPAGTGHRAGTVAPCEVKHSVIM